MGGLTRKVLVLAGVALIAMLLLPAAAAVAQEQYPPSVEVAGASATRTAGTATHHDPTNAKALAFTGSSDTIPTIWVAVGLVVFGGALVFVARQRRTASNRS